jgi:hypothetical protein
MGAAMTGYYRNARRDVHGGVVNERLSVGSSFKNGWFIGPLIVGAILVGMDAIWGREWRTEGALYLVGGIGLFLSLVAWAVIFLRRRFLEVDADGFVIEGPGFHQKWRDVEVARMAWFSKRNYANGIPASDTVSVEVVDAKNRRVKMSHDVSLQSTTVDLPPFVALVRRLFEGLVERTKEQLGKGGEVKGDGWALDRDRVKFKTGEIPIGEITAVAEFDGQVRLWKKGSDDAAFGVGAGTMNATLLQRLADEMKPKQEVAAASDEGLGRVLFERKGGTRPLMLYLVAVVVILIGVPVLTASIGGGLAMLGFAALLIAWGWWAGALLLRCHERGVSRRTRLATTTIRYRDVAMYQYQATRHFVNGAYTGTTIAMEFASRPELGKQKISWSVSARGMDEELENLRDHISKVMASRWLEELKAGKSVDWTANLRLLPDGVEYRPSGFIGRKDWTKASFAELGDTSMEQGIFYLFLKGAEKSCVGENVSAPNFFPGYYVLMLALHPPGN